VPHLARLRVDRRVAVRARVELVVELICVGLGLRHRRGELQVGCARDEPPGHDNVADRGRRVDARLEEVESTARAVCECAHHDGE
jgi:hypothetical protein